MTRKKVTARAEQLDVECGRVLGPDRGECLLPAGHRDTWCQDAEALNAREYLEHCRDTIETVSVEKLREVLMLAWVLTGYRPDVRPDHMSGDLVRREAWWLVWTGGCPR